MLSIQKTVQLIRQRKQQLYRQMIQVQIRQKQQRHKHRIRPAVFQVWSKTYHQPSSALQTIKHKVKQTTDFGDMNTPFDGSQQNQNSSSQEQESGTGSGVIFKKSGSKAYVLTNNHVIEGANKLTVSLHDGKTVAGKVVGSDPLTDLAVVEISSSQRYKSR